MVASENHIKSYTSSRFTGGNNRRNQSFSKGHQRLDSQTVIKGRCKSHDKVSMRSMGVPQKMQLPPPEGASSDSKTTITTELSRSGHSELGHMNHDNTPTAVSIYEKVVENSNDDEFIVEYNEKLMTSFCCPGLSHSRNSNSLKEKSILENKNNNNNKDKDEEANNAEDGGFVTKIEEAFMYLMGRAPPVRIIYCSEENSVENSEVSIPKVLTDMEQLYIMEQLQLHEHQQRQDSFEPSEKHNHQLCTQKSFDESTDLSAALSATLSASKSFRSCRLSRTFSKSFTRSTSATAHTSIDEKSKSNTISTELESLRSKDSIMDLSLLDRSNTGIIEIKNLVKSKKKKVVLFRNRSKKGSDKVLSQAGLAEC